MREDVGEKAKELLEKIKEKGREYLKKLWERLGISKRAIEMNMEALQAE